ncbi:hypothetical protein [Enterovibrio norvegicus]|uniref:hypothetical protein n=1 Tax=Enterovibrio norvegicus TaxID=188144 RepID=UPI0024B07EF6|nr:hypothetical protein [Enterovibrio norvegicus]
MKSYMHWFKCDYPKAINTCEEALYLLGKAKQDDKYKIAHTLALSQRDSGNLDDINKALEYFRGATSIEELLSVGNISKSSDGPMFGNVGKCLYLSGDVEGALICYAKSFYYLFESDSSNRLINLGYASSWLADLLFELGKSEASYYFYSFSFESWSSSSPILSNRNKSKISKFEDNSTYRSISSQELWRIEKYCNNWINNHLKNEVDSI